MARVLSVLLDDLPVGRLTLGATDGSDMHHKNWSLIYPDGLNAALSPPMIWSPPSSITRMTRWR